MTEGVKRKRNEDEAIIESTECAIYWTDATREKRYRFDDDDDDNDHDHDHAKRCRLRRKAARPLTFLGDHRVPLTAQALQQLNRQNLQESQYPSGDTVSPPPSASEMTSVDASNPSIGLSPHSDPALYESQLWKRGIFALEDEDERDPLDKQEFLDALYQDRNSPPPTSEQGRFFKKKARQCTNEREVDAQVVPEIVELEELYKSSKYATSQDQLWKANSCLHADAVEQNGPVLKMAKPDFTIGFDAQYINCYTACTKCEAVATPVKGRFDLLCPVFTIESKGPGGHIRIARLQNRYNAANMVRNNLWLWQAADKNVELYFDRIQVGTLCVTPDTVEISYYWASQNPKGGKIEYFSKECTFGLDRGLASVRTPARNALEWIMNRNEAWIIEAMRRINDNHAQAIKTLPTPQSSIQPSSRSRSNSPRKRRAPDSEVSL